MLRSRRDALIRVLLVHDICLLRTALAALLEREAGIDVASSSWRNARRTAHALDPQVCVIDAECPGAAERLPCLERQLTDRIGAGCALVVLAAAGKPGQLRRAFEARALGFVDKGRSPQRLATAIRRVAEGQRFVDDSLAPDFLSASDMPFTRRELTVLSLSADGAPIPEIARALNLAHGTVRNYLATITRKAGARNRVDAIRISRGAGWV
ncbi:response regulator transcription factor [Streptacidiphilus carbonis]|jgi:two-component system, NarL family, response regulator DesR|uniref:LuxR C-terminal-related transcriptional regulator n=1 Tax=Streptacidiphilus carbonis TaxID=105422 RepID=UPI0009FF5A1D|nr:response regulator transcription factor [Streptacidiphilus carbonis]